MHKISKILFCFLLVPIVISCNSKTINKEEKVENLPVVSMSKPNILLSWQMTLATRLWVATEALPTQNPISTHLPKGV